jgi:hypothetical protein
MEGEVVLALLTVGLLALVVLGAWLYMLLGRGTISGAGAAFVTWLVVTAATLGAGFMIAFPGIHMLLFLFGIEAGWVGIVLAVALAVAVPVFWAVIIRRKIHHGTPGLPVGS